MGRRIHQRGLALCLVALFAGACGTWVGNPDDDGGGSASQTTSYVELDIQGSTEEFELASAPLAVSDADGNEIGHLSLSIAKVVLYEIKLKLDSDDGEEREKFTGPFVVDLLTNTIVPDAKEITLPKGNYKKIELHLHKLNKDDAQAAGLESSDPLIGNSIYLKGVFTGIDGTQKDFTMLYEQGEVFKMDSSSGIDLGAGGKEQLLILFKLRQWLNFADASTNKSRISFDDFPSSSIVLDKDASSSEKVLQKVIKENIKKSAGFRKK